MTESDKFRTTPFKFPENFEQDSFKSSTNVHLSGFCSMVDAVWVPWPGFFLLLLRKADGAFRRRSKIIGIEGAGKRGSAT